MAITVMTESIVALFDADIIGGIIFTFNSHQLQTSRLFVGVSSSVVFS